MRALDLMTPFPVLATEDEALPTLASHLATLQVHHLPVVGASGALSGMVFDYDVFRRGSFFGPSWVSFEEGEHVSDARAVMVPVDVAVGADAELTVVLRQMAVTRQDCAVVVDDNGHPVGIITEHDVLKVAVAYGSEALLGRHEASAPVTSVGRDTPAHEALTLMTERRFRHLAVTDADGQLVGMVSYRDLVTDNAAHRPELKTVDALRTTEPRTSTGAATLAELAAMMMEESVGSMPLVDDGGRPVAIVTRRDVLEAVVAALETEDLFGSDA